VGTGTKEDESSTGRVWAAGFHHVTARSDVLEWVRGQRKMSQVLGAFGLLDFTICSRLARVLKHMNRLFL
jgi:hypothetical protein